MPPSDAPVSLTRRERQIVALVAQGFRNPDIAEALSIAEQSVRNHVSRIFKKTGSRDRLDLALYAVYYRLHDPRKKLG